MNTPVQDLRFLQELFDVGRLFVRPHLTALTPTTLSEPARMSLSRIGTLLKGQDAKSFDSGDSTPKVFVVARNQSVCFVTPTPQQAAMSDIDELFRFFGHTLEREVISDIPPV